MKERNEFYFEFEYDYNVWGGQYTNLTASDEVDDLIGNRAYAYVWNKDDEWCSEFGTISVASFGGGIARRG